MLPTSMCRGVRGRLDPDMDVKGIRCCASNGSELRRGETICDWASMLSPAPRLGDLSASSRGERSGVPPRSLGRDLDHPPTIAVRHRSRAGRHDGLTRGSTHASGQRAELAVRL